MGQKDSELIRTNEGNMNDGSWTDSLLEPLEQRHFESVQVLFTGSK